MSLLKKLFPHGILTLALTAGFVAAQAQTQPKIRLKPDNSQKTVRKAAPPVSSRSIVKVPAPSSAKAASQGSSHRLLAEASELIKKGETARAATLLYSLAPRQDMVQERAQIKYLLGLALMDLKMYQVAAFQFVDVLRQGTGRYTKSAIEKLIVAADALGDDTLLNYAIAKVELEGFPSQYLDMLYYRLGEVRQKNGRFAEAIQYYSRVPASSRFSSQALFNKGLSHLELKNTSEALKIFQEMLASRSKASVTDTNRVGAQLAIARTYYQAQKWEEASEAYRKIPRDTEMWHDALFEMSWADLRAAKFRSALSNFQSLHSSYYEDYYYPESLLVRAIVYLYICKYDEMEKVLNIFESTYGPMRTKLGRFIQQSKDPISYYNEIEKAQAARSDLSKTQTLKVPYSVARFVLNQGDVHRSMNYLKNLQSEKSRLESSALARGPFQKYANKILENRMRNTKISIGEMVRNHFSAVRTELKDLYEQESFARYEMINGKKEQLKKKIAGKDISGDQIDEEVNRQFYIQNGYEYWPFKGEYWLDEIGNYHYLGRQSCD